MASDLKNLPSDPEALQKIIKEQEERLHNYEAENRALLDELSLSRARQFGRKSEKYSALKDELSLVFNEIETLADQSSEQPLEESVTKVSEYKRSRAGRKKLPDHLRRITTTRDVSEAEKICGCGAKKYKIGEESSEKLQYIPADAYVERTVRPKYACRKCKGMDDDGQPVAVAPAASSITGQSSIGESLLAHIITYKFEYAIPFYRQEKILRDIEVELGRQSMANTARNVHQRLHPLEELLFEQINDAYLLGIDATTMQVLKEKGRRPDQLSSMWHILASTRDGPVPLYLYRESKSASVLDALLSEYSGPIMTDGDNSFNRWNAIKRFIHAGCNAHARRKFTDADKVGPGNSDVADVLNLYRKVYIIEDMLRKERADFDRIRQVRNEKSRPIMNSLFNKLQKMAADYNPKGAVGKAVAYTLREWPKLILFLDYPEIPIDNNAVENKIRPFVLGRKNWLFNDSPEGADASVFYYSLVEGAKAAGLNPHQYLLYVFRKAPYADTKADWQALLPLSLKGQDLSRLLAEGEI